MSRWLPRLAFVQGVYFAATGAWSLVHMPSFLAVTGPKRDIWLVRTVGVLVLAIGAVLMMAAARDRVTPEVALLAVGSAAGLTGIDVKYVADGTLREVYLLDAAAEVALLAAWGWAWAHAKRHQHALLDVPL